MLTRVALVALVGACIVLGLCAVVRGTEIERLAAAAVEARRAQDAAELRAAGAVAAHELTVRELRAALADADARLREALERVQRAVPGARVVSIVQGSTGPVAAPDPRDTAGPGAVAGPPPLPPAAAPICLLRAGDTGEVRAEVAELRTEAGASALVGSLSCVRLTDGPQEILGGPLRLDVSRWLRAPEPERRAPAWALEVRAGLGTRGVEGGATLYGKGRIGGWAQSWWEPGAAPGESAWGAAGGVSLRVGRR